MKFPVMFTCVMGAGSIGAAFGLPGVFVGLIVGLIVGAVVEKKVK